MFEQRYFKTSQLTNRYQVCEMTIYRWRNKKGFPHPAVQEEGRENLYLVTEVEAWDLAREQATKDRRAAKQAKVA